MITQFVHLTVNELPQGSHILKRRLPLLSENGASKATPQRVEALLRVGRLFVYVCVWEVGIRPK